MKLEDCQPDTRSPNAIRRADCGRPICTSMAPARSVFGGRSRRDPRPIAQNCLRRRRQNRRLRCRAQNGQFHLPEALRTETARHDRNSMEYRSSSVRLEKEMTSAVFYTATGAGAEPMAPARDYTYDILAIL